MRITKILVFFSSFLFFSFNTIQRTEAGLKDQYKTDSDCNWFSAQYDAYKFINPSNSNLQKRYCITKDNKVIAVLFGTNCVGSMCFDYPREGNSTLLSGKIGESESYQGTNVFGRIQYYISEWDVEGDKLISYQCQTEILSGKCSGKTEKTISGIHRTKTNISKFYNDLGYISGLKGDHKKAIFHFNKVIDLNLDKDQISQTFVNRGYSKMQLGDMSGACSDFRKGYDRLPIQHRDGVDGLMDKVC